MQIVDQRLARLKLRNTSRIIENVSALRPNWLCSWKENLSWDESFSTLIPLMKTRFAGYYRKLKSFLKTVAGQIFVLFVLSWDFAILIEFLPRYTLFMPTYLLYCNISIRNIFQGY